MLLAVAGFVLGIYLSLRAQPELFSNVVWWPIMLVAAVGVPVTVTLNAVEFRQSALLIGQRFSLWRSFEITIIGSVANMLPLPGGTMVRVAALKAGGSSLKQGTFVTLMVSGLWIGVAFVYGGLWLVPMEKAIAGLGGVFLAVGGAAIISCIVISGRHFQDVHHLRTLALIKIGQVLIDASRIWLCLTALGLSATFAQASVLTVSSVMGAAISIVPAGLGVREAVAALLGPIVLLSAAGAYLSASLNRIVGLMITAPIALIVALRRNRG